MTWISTIGYDQANDRLRKLYDRVRGADDGDVPISVEIRGAGVAG